MRLRAIATLVAGTLLASAAGCGSQDPASSGPDRPAGAGGPQPTARTTPPRPPHQRQPVDRLSLRQQVGEVVVLAFGGADAPEYVRRALREGRTTGAILFGGNVQSAGQLRRLTGELQSASGHRALVMTDQEGGPIRIVGFAPPDVGQARQATPQAAAAQASAAARALRGLGVNVTLTPVADVAIPGAAVAARTFGSDPDSVAERVGAAVRAYAQGGVAATAKHFPGFGRATENTDFAAVTIRGVGAGDLAPFKRAIADGVPLVMASHGLYPQLDPDHIASQSPAILNGLLRERLGFRGVVITDSMEAKAVTSRSPIEVAAQRALTGGADLLLFTGDGSFRPVSLHLYAEARRSPALRARLRVAASRVLALKRRLGLRAPR